MREFNGDIDGAVIHCICASLHAWIPARCAPADSQGPQGSIEPSSQDPTIELEARLPWAAAHHISLSPPTVAGDSGDSDAENDVVT